MRKQENVKEREALVISRAQDICNAYDPSIAFSQLSSADGVEIAFVTDGGGVHQVLNQAIPCKSGDIFVVPHIDRLGVFGECVIAVFGIRKERFRRIILNAE